MRWGSWVGAVVVVLSLYHWIARSVLEILKEEGEGGDGLGNTGRLVLKKLWVFFVWASTLNMGFINKGWYGMFVACGIWCLADFSSVSPSSASVNLCLSNPYFSGKCLIFKVSLIGFSQLKSSFGFFNWKNVSLWIYMYHSTPPPTPTPLINHWGGLLYNVLWC